MNHYYLLIVLILSCIWWTSNAFPLGYFKDPSNDVDQKEQNTINKPNNKTINHQSSTNQVCQGLMTYNEIISSLTKTPCVFIEKPIQSNDTDQLIDDISINGRMKRFITGGNVDIYALQTTINDHRSMINYLMNNSVNFTVVFDAITDHHSRTGPVLTSWRDITLLCIQVLSFIIIMYFIFCYIGCRPIDNVLRWILKPMNNRLQEPPISINTKQHQASGRKLQQPQPIPTISRDIARDYHHGSVSD